MGCRPVGSGGGFEMGMAYDAGMEGIVYEDVDAAGF